MDEKEVILQVNNLCKDYGNRRVVNNVNLSIFQGEIFGLLGPNGAGKSTLIKMITGLTSTTFGDVFICGYNLKKNFEKAIKNVGAVIESPALYSFMSGLNNLKYFASLNGKVSQVEIMDIINAVGLKNRIKDKVSTYSLGMKQRLAIAQALLNKPKLLILDEATNGLDANGIKEIRLLLKMLAKDGISIILSSHILSEMENLCDKIAIIDKGVVVTQNSIEKLKSEVSKIGTNYVRVNAVNYAGKLIEQATKQKVSISGDKVIFNADEKKLAQIILFLTQNRISIFGAGEVDFSLEDIFLSVVDNSTSVK